MKHSQGLILTLNLNSEVGGCDFYLFADSTKVFKTLINGTKYTKHPSIPVERALIERARERPLHQVTLRQLGNSG